MNYDTTLTVKKFCQDIIIEKKTNNFRIIDSFSLTYCNLKNNKRLRRTVSESHVSTLKPLSISGEKTHSLYIFKMLR